MNVYYYEHFFFARRYLGDVQCCFCRTHRKPVSRYEVIKLQEAMDDMLNKAGLADIDSDLQGPTEVCAVYLILLNMLTASKSLPENP